MAKASDLLGKAGGSGFGPGPKPSHIQPVAPEGKDQKDITKSHPVKDARPTKPGKGTGGGGSAPVSVRPKV